MYAIVRVIVVICVLSGFCGIGVCQEPVKQDEGVEEAGPVKKIEIKSIIIKYNIESENEKGTEEFYYDGEKTALITDTYRYIPRKDKKIHKHLMTVVKDNQIYKADLERKQAVQVPLPDNNRDMIKTFIGGNVLVKDIDKYEPIGQEKILGYMCNIYQVPVLGKIWVWNDVILKMENTMRKKLIKQADFMQINVPIGYTKFKIPSDVKIMDIFMNKEDEEIE